MRSFPNLLAGLWPALKHVSFASIVALLVTCGPAQQAPGSANRAPGSANRAPGSAKRAPVSAKRCGHSKANILGTWSKPVVHTVTKNGHMTPSGGWQTSLWLPGFHIDKAGRCRFSCASDTPLSMVLAVRQSATFVLVADISHGSRRLRLGHATLTAPGMTPLRQTATKEIARDLPPYRVRHGFHEYLFSFPPLQPTWNQLELRVPIKGTDASLLVRFTRKAPAPE